MFRVDEVPNFVKDSETLSLLGQTGLGGDQAIIEA